MQAANFRWASEADFDALSDVVFDAIRNGPSPYTEAQRAAWMPARPSGSVWRERLGAQDIVVAEIGGAMVGFMSLARTGYVDFAHLRPQARGSGLFRAMFERIYARARDRGEPRLWVHASLMAEPAFRAVGFEVVRREQVAVGDEELDRCEMERPLSSQA